MTLDTTAPWYSYNRIDNFGTIDPQGSYYKPDSNILTPPGYPVTALLSGTVTNVQRTAWGQSVVTIRMDRPLNALATHYYYEHMHSANVYVGQRVKPGDLIGLANFSGEGAPLGFGLYSGDVYGSGSAWGQIQQDLAPGGKGLLNPTILLNQAKDGTLGTFTTTTGAGSSSGSGNQGTSWGAKVGIFVLAIVGAIAGAYILFQQQVDAAAGKAVKAVAA